MKDQKAAMGISDDMLDRVAGGIKRSVSGGKDVAGPMPSAAGVGSTNTGSEQEFDCPTCGVRHAFIIGSGNRAIGVGCNTQIEV